MISAPLVECPSDGLGRGQRSGPGYSNEVTRGRYVGTSGRVCLPLGRCCASLNQNVMIQWIRAVHWPLADAEHWSRVLVWMARKSGTGWLRVWVWTRAQQAIVDPEPSDALVMRALCPGRRTGKARRACGSRVHGQDPVSQADTGQRQGPGRLTATCVAGPRLPSPLHPSLPSLAPMLQPPTLPRCCSIRMERRYDARYGALTHTPT